ncbi:serine/threonine-protein kinase HipA [Aequitasia blattaphilus]|uniref:HipA N-terminal domain-containing protein n=1 Tax=Aequitasia blattaphilus TaxID=2949332 RepID=A0ABT1EAZ0_9FIRM|nr:HipA N-terminal domain-containing protein [Aequitasia blattaphilus]MCP1102851.1 HipA N-terminal domain-containing protein [Aequitasia blattaphilus]MCR8615491.1 HipA N-terminal domain-containing protein [Aequitasia blattaphilus]
MANEYRRGFVYVQNIFAGIIEETDEGYLFTYDEEYQSSEAAVAVSVTLPLEKKEYFSKTLFPFFDGLIPEGWLLKVVSRNWKVRQDDRFGLLLIACRDCIGDVSVRGEK